jgi:hypothetical protein
MPMIATGLSGVIQECEVAVNQVIHLATTAYVRRYSLCVAIAPAAR